MNRTLLCIAALLLAGAALGGDTLPPLVLKDEGVTKGVITSINCVGSSITCTRANTGAATVTISGASGTVSSVAASGPTGIATWSAAVTTSGTLTQTLSNQSANTILAGPTSGSAAAPTFRAPVYADVTGVAEPDPRAGLHMHGTWQATDVSAANISVFGLYSATATTSGTSSTDATGSHLYATLASSTVTNNASSVCEGSPCAYRDTRANFSPVTIAYYKTDASLTSERVWAVAQTSGALSAIALTTSITANATKLVALGFDTAVSANWLLCSGDGTNYDCTSTGVAVTAATEYILTLDLNRAAASTLTGTVNGTSTTKTTRLPASNISLGPYSSCTNLAAVACKLSISFMGLYD